MQVKTKAIHSEVATDQSTNEFLECLKRFTAIRGVPCRIYSDNGRNFVGASNILPKWASEQAQENIDLQNQLTIRGIQWTFIAPSAPHFGGIWEAAVKSTKRLLMKTCGASRFTYKNLNTVLKQVEAILNSRPLSPMTDDPNDLEVLTPGHFLIGHPLTMVPEADGVGDKCQQIRPVPAAATDDYLHQLQIRAKWHTQKPNLQVGQIVIVHDSQTSPANWQLARIVEVFPDKTNTVRTVKITQNNNYYVRPIHKLSLCKY